MPIHYEPIQTDLTVVGGGMSGVCAAIAAARRGLDVALVQDRPVLGGNASSEVRVWVNGATGGKHNRYAREGGIMEELLLENKYRNPDGNAHLWDMILLDAVRAEPSLHLFLNTLVTEVESDGARVTSAAGHQLMSERHFRFESPLFVDASGDGVLAAGAGAQFHIGRESKAAFGEQWAPEEADPRTLGASIMFYTKDAGYPVAFRPPRLARDFKVDTPPIIYKRVDPKHTRCCYWWFEYGGELDTIKDNEAIRDELLAIVYGAWDYLKNSGRFPDVENLQLEWVGSIPGKRESRRFVGDYILTEHDVVSQRRFDDAVAHGGWSIDLHPPQGTYHEQGEGSRHWHIEGPYSIPYRILYCKDIENVFLAGRLVSASHVAFGTLRVQMTLATMGQAVGEAAALCLEHGCTPRGVNEAHLGALQQRLLRGDQWVIGIPNEDQGDIARQAEVTASSEHPLALEPEGSVIPLARDVWLHLPAAEAIDSVAVYADPTRPARLKVEVWRESRPENYIPYEHVHSFEVPVSQTGWIDLPVGFDPGDGEGLFLLFKADPDVRLLGNQTVLTGVLAGTVSGKGSTRRWPVAPWLPAFKVSPQIDTYGARCAVDGFARPYGLPHAWISQPLQPGDPAWLALRWDQPRRVARVQLTFNTNLTLWYNHLMPQTGEAAPECVRDYTIEARVDGRWERLVQVDGNYQRVRTHSIETPVKTDQIRLTITATNGAPRAEVFEMRVYEA